MKFTKDWFSGNILNFQMVMSLCPIRDNFLEIGSYEGRSACWLLQNALDPDGTLTCIDPLVQEGIEETFRSNTAEVIGPRQKLRVLRGRSYYELPKLILDRAKFDFIYIDGSHIPSNTLIDLCMTWNLLREGGIVLLDDYKLKWLRPGKAMDAFMDVFAGQFEIVLKNYQLALFKYRQETDIDPSPPAPEVTQPAIHPDIPVSSLPGPTGPSL